MILKTVFVRFYKSFNYDYLKIVQNNATKRAWEMIDDMWYPYVKIPIDPKVTTVVGANESGKSHLLSAIEKGISGEDIKPEDFCRYSRFFSVERNEIKSPDFGFEWCNLSDTEINYVRNACDIDESIKFNEFLIFRTDKKNLTVYLLSEGNYKPYPVKKGKDFKEIFPRVFTIDSDIGLPDSVSIKGLATNFKEEKSQLERMRRAERFDLVDTLSPMVNLLPMLETAEGITQQAGKIQKAAAPSLKKLQSLQFNTTSLETKQLENQLAYNLICEIGNVDPQALQDLYEAIKNEKDGHANGIVQKINDNLAKNLNFPKWWVQDRNFRLIVTPREFDLVFTIRDRTETDYSFSERSSGLKYFLSYYVQYRAHKPVEGKTEILTMDEPDTYLSSQAQQDLLKIFEAFAFPEEGRDPIQVIYVTHSPFLIDKNHSERIRVLEKGAEEEGTRVVKDTAKNHYEPLRSAFGAYVGETAFIGNCNLMVEGSADQVLLAGAATYLRRKGLSDISSSQTLDLNYLTIVPAGSASHVPYLVYLARGRGEEQPAVIVLLDSDPSGNEAKRTLGRGGAYNRQLLKPEYILQIQDLADAPNLTVSENNKLIEIEDLIPIPICVEAAKKYAKEICHAKDENIEKITIEVVENSLKGKNSIFDVLEDLFKTLSEDGLHIEKIGFARNVIEIVSNNSEEFQNLSLETINEFDQNFKILFEKLNKMRRAAERELSGEKVSKKINRLKKRFLQNYPNNSRKENVVILFEEMEAALDDTAESNKVKYAINDLRLKYELEEVVNESIADYENFKTDLNKIVYAGRIAAQEQQFTSNDLPNSQTLKSEIVSTEQ